MAKAIRVHKTGGPEVLQLEDVTLPAPGPGQILLRNRAIGLNFIDVYTRTGLYPGPTPAVLGVEAAGVVEALGEGVSGLNVATAWSTMAFQGPMPRAGTPRPSG